MINPFSRFYFAIAALTAGTAIAYNISVSDRAGALLFFFVFLATAIAGVVVVGPWVKDTAPWVPVDAPPPEQIVVGRSAAPKASAWPLVAAAAVGLLAAGLTVGAWMVAAGLVVSLVAAGGWVGQSFREDPTFSPRASARVWERVVGPIGVPVTALVLTAFIVVCVSRVLLAVSKEASVIVALLLAVLVLLGFWFLASRPRSNKVLLGTLGGVAMVSLAAAGIAGAANGERTFEEHEVPANVFSLTAKNTQFSKSVINAKAGTVTVVFHNDDAGTYHNVGVYTAPSGGKPVVNSGQPIQGVDRKTYQFSLSQPGTYSFRCDFHLNMVGTLNVQ
ncbi:MAG: cupredoxin domain-containing protein [Catenulispora sp.]